MDPQRPCCQSRENLHVLVGYGPLVHVDSSGGGQSAGMAITRAICVVRWSASGTGGGNNQNSMTGRGPGSTNRHQNHGATHPGNPVLGYARRG